MAIFGAYLRLTLQEYATYRLNFLFWRFRMFTRLLISLFVWKAIFTENVNVGVYTGQSIVQYMVLTHLLGALVLSSIVDEVGDKINSGALSNSLLRPSHYLTELLGKEAGDKLWNILFLPIEIILALWITGLSFHLPESLPFFAIVLTGVSLVLYFFIGFLISLVGFWTTEVWAVRFFVTILLEFCAGTFIPLDLYPTWMTKLLFLTPFPYVLYVPIRLFLGMSVPSDHLLISSVTWTIITGILVYIVWKKGLRRYEGQGR